MSEEDNEEPQIGDLVQVMSWGKTPVATGILIKVYDKANFHGNESFEHKIYDVLCLDSGQIRSYDEPYYTIIKID